MENYAVNEYSENRISAQNKFLSGVYGWMAFALGLSAIVAWGTAWYTGQNPQAFKALFGGGFIFFAIAELVLVIVLSAAIRKLSAFTATVCFLVYSVLNGITLSSIFYVYELTSIVNIFGVSAATFLCMAIYGSRTKNDLMGYGKFFSMAIIGIFFASILNIFLRSSRFDWMISIVAVILFTGITAYDAQKMILVSRHANGSEVFKKASIIGALELYLDFINIFIRLLSLFGKRK